MLRQYELIEKVRTYGAAWKVELEKLITDFPQQLKAVTGRGYMLGMVLPGDPAPCVAALREAGLLAPTAGGNTVRLLPPLIATQADLDRATAIIRSVFARRN